MDVIRKELAEIPKEELDKYGLDLSEAMDLYEGKGCEECANTGYKGRIAIFEALEIDRQIKEIITGSGGNEMEISEHAKKQGMISMKQDGYIKALLGLTSLSEIERVTEGSKSVGGEIEDDKG